MSAFILIPGAGGDPWYWHRLTPMLRHGGHEVVAIDMPGDDPRAGLDEYAHAATAAMTGLERIVLVAQSLGGFTAPMAANLAGNVEAARRPPAEGASEAVNRYDYFLHDVPPPTIAAAVLRRH